MNSHENCEVAQKASIRHTFQMLTPDDLCIIMKIPIKTPLRSVALVKAFSYPLIINKTLRVAQNPPPLFLHLSGAFYVKLDESTYNECDIKGICKGLSLPQAANEEECAIAQYFHKGSTRCPLRKIQRTSHLLYAGTTLFYAILDQLRIRLECHDSDMEDIVHISGRGAFKTPESCTLKSSKAIFPLQKPSKVFVANSTMGPEATITQGQG